IVDLDKTRIEQYVEKWFKSEADEQEHFADEIPDAELFRRSLWSNQPVLELAKTPLLLTIMCQLYSSGREFPKDRNALFDDASELFIRNWDAWNKVARSSRSDDSHGGHHSLSNTNRKLLLARIAYKGFQSPSGVQFSWEGEELNEIIQEFMKNVSGFRKESQKIESREMLRTIEFQNGLLIKHDGNNYRFSHLAFQESFAAQEMKESLTLEQIIEQVDLHIDDPAWHTALQNLVAKIRKPQDTAAILRQIFYHMSLGVKDSKAIQDWLTWLTNMTARANVQTPSWRSCIAAFDHQTFLNSDPSSIPGDVKELAYPIAANLREINISSYQITPRTPLCQLQLDLAVAHTVAHKLSQGESEKVRFISGYDSRYESLETSESSFDILVSFDRLFSNIIELAEKEQATTMDVKESLPVLKKLQLSRPKSTQEQKAWADWAATLASTMQTHYGTGTGAKLSEEDQAALSRYTRLTSLLSECLQDDIYCSPDDRRIIFDHLFLPHHKIPSELTRLSDSRQVALSK
ncbi:MAG: NACHT domain-containing protein, partial [Cyanophyceae cyanobacterium]